MGVMIWCLQSIFLNDFFIYIDPKISRITWWLNMFSLGCCIAYRLLRRRGYTGSHREMVHEHLGVDAWLTPPPLCMEWGAYCLSKHMEFKVRKPRPYVLFTPSLSRAQGQQQSPWPVGFGRYRRALSHLLAMTNSSTVVCIIL